MNNEIKQIIPLPDNITPVISFHQDDGSQLWEDAARHGWIVQLALLADDEIHPVYVTPDGDSEVDENYTAVAFRPAIRCPKCGQKMWVLPHRSDYTRLDYLCPCGVTRSVDCDA